MQSRTMLLLVLLSAFGGFPITPFLRSWTRLALGI
jgi:hypothetical protein